MTSKMNVADVERESAEENLRAIRSNRNITADMVDRNGKMKCMFYQSNSQYGDIRISINHVYLHKSENAIKNDKRAINIYCRNGEKRNFGETDAWYQHL